MAVSILSTSFVIPEPADAVVGLLNATIFLAIIASLVVRYVRGDARQRSQVFWLIIALVIMLVINSQRWLTGDGPIVALLTFILVPVAITIAVLRHRLLARGARWRAQGDELPTNAVTATGTHEPIFRRVGACQTGPAPRRTHVLPQQVPAISLDGIRTRRMVRAGSTRRLQGTMRPLGILSGTIGAAAVAIPSLICIGRAITGIYPASTGLLLAMLVTLGTLTAVGIMAVRNLRVGLPQKTAILCGEAALAFIVIALELLSHS